jgi:hypothetical protein
VSRHCGRYGRPLSSGEGQGQTPGSLFPNRRLSTKGPGDLMRCLQCVCTLTMRHAEPVGFCGRGRGTHKGCREALAPDRPRALHEYQQRDAKHVCLVECTGAGRLSGATRPGDAAEGTSLWREPVCWRCRDKCEGNGPLMIRMTSAWRMPRRWRPRKDAATRRNTRGRRWQPAIPGSPNGATRPAHGRAPSRCWEGTGGTETSQYPEEQRGFPQ